MAKTSAGILLFKCNSSKNIEVLLGHMGGPYFAEKDLGTWTIPKGETEDGEDILQTALREFNEETGLDADITKLIPLKCIKQKAGKIVHAWAMEDTNSIDPDSLKCNPFEMEYPYKSGKFVKFPEMDKFEFFNLEIAMQKINPAQQDFLKELHQVLMFDSS